MKAAIIMVGMGEERGEDAHSEAGHGGILEAAAAFLGRCRRLSVPVIFACDSFLEGDFIFKGGLRPRAVRGTAGTAVLAVLSPAPQDIVLPKRRFSAFFKTDLDQTLRTMGVDTVAVAGATTAFGVLATAIDAVCHDFSTIIIEDLCVSPSREIHEGLMDAYRNSIIYPLFRVSSADELLDALSHG